MSPGAAVSIIADCMLKKTSPFIGLHACLQIQMFYQCSTRVCNVRKPHIWRVFLLLLGNKQTVILYISVLGLLTAAGSRTVFSKM